MPSRAREPGRRPAGTAHPRAAGPRLRGHRGAVPRGRRRPRGPRGPARRRPGRRPLALRRRAPGRRARPGCACSASAGRSWSGTSGTGCSRTRGSSCVEETSVLDLAFTGDTRRVNGVIVTEGDGARPAPAARPGWSWTPPGARRGLPEWLERRGYPAPERGGTSRRQALDHPDVPPGPGTRAAGDRGPGQAGPSARRGDGGGGGRPVDRDAQRPARRPAAQRPVRVPGLRPLPRLAGDRGHAGRGGTAGRRDDLPVPGEPATPLRAPHRVPGRACSRPGTRCAPSTRCWHRG